MALIFPTAEQIKAVEAERLPNLIANRPIFNIMPIVNEDAPVVRWEQQDNYVGLQNLRGIGGQPGRVKRTGSKVYTMEPGFYGDYIPLDEVELTMRAQSAGGAPIDLRQMVMKVSEQLQARFLDRVEQVGWNALLGTFTVLGPGGAAVHTDTFPVQTASAAVSWATYATATPILDFRNAKLLGRGKGVSFGRGARAFMNTGTLNNLLQNGNAADLYGRRNANTGTISGLGDLNKIMLDADCPEIVEEDGGYLNDSGTWVNFIPDNQVIIVGRPVTGAPIADYAMVRNVNNPNMAPGQYTKVVADEDDVPFKVEVHNGHNGGPRIYRPGSVCILSV
jgi:hypothetical protein